MTKQDYEKIAAALRGSRPADFDGPMAMAQWERSREAIAFMLERDNPRFRMTEFYRATVPA